MILYANIEHKVGASLYVLSIGRGETITRKKRIGYRT